jgi:DNA-binding transcriptional MerR regulator
MRLTELAQASGVSPATIKYYLREQVLHPGRAVTARLADYDATHVRRLRLLRVLREVGDVPVTRLQSLARAVEAETTLHDLLGTAADALAPEPPATTPDDRAEADAVIRAAGWEVRPGARDRENLAAVLQTFRAWTGRPLPAEAIAPYLRAADALARMEIEALDPSSGRTYLVERMVVGQVVFGQLLAILRRLAEEHHSSQRFG